MKPYDRHVDYCTFMVAIVLSRIIIGNDDIDRQWRAEELSEKVNKMRWSDSADFHVDSIALKHGLSLFQKLIQNRGVSAIEVYKVDRGLSKYFNLQDSRRSIELKFISCRPAREESTANDILNDIICIRDEIAKQYKYEKSIYSTPSSVFVAIHMPKAFKVLKTKTPTHLRKSPSELCKRSISNNSRKVLESVEKKFGEEHAAFYLNGAIIKSETKKRKISTELIDDNNTIDSEMNSDEGSDSNISDDGEGNGRHHCADLDTDERVLSAYRELPLKYVKYNDIDQDNILKIFHVILNLATERDYKNPTYSAAEVASKLFGTRSYYSQISARTILRWHELKDKVNDRTGKKINEEFESDVWGKLMLCVFEKVRSNTLSII